MKEQVLFSLSLERLEPIFKGWVRDELSKYQSLTVCHACHGHRLNTQALSIKVDERHIGQITKMSISQAIEFFEGLYSKLNKIEKAIAEKNEIFWQELIWREFFMQILFHYPKVVNENFKSKYNFISWRNNETEFKNWCEGKTGYAIVDAGMRQLNKTGYMHNRVRMITASFLCKHLLTEKLFAV